MIKYLVVIILFFSNSLWSQDSLLNWVEENKSNNDTILCHNYYLIGREYYIANDVEKSIEYILLSQDKSNDLEWEKGGAQADNLLGFVYSGLGKTKKALDRYYAALTYFEKQKDTITLAQIYHNLGNTYFTLKKLEDASREWELAKQFYLAQNSLLDIADVEINLGALYTDLGESEKAMRSYEGARNIFAENNSKYLMNQADLGILVLKSKVDMADNVNLIPGFEYLAHYFDSVGSTEYASIARLNLGGIYLQNKDYALANENFLKVTEDSVNQSIRVLTHVYGDMSAAYTGLRDYETALNYLTKRNALRDSVFSLESADALVEMQTKYENDKLISKQEIDQLTIDREKQKATQQWYYTLGALIGVAFLIGLASLLLRGNRIKQKANTSLQSAHDKIEKQHDVIQEINSDLTASIDYAKRLQQAILPTYDYIGEGFKDFFIYFKPRDIVSGDFYWYHKEANFVVMAVADCTGHGVPGAFVSMTCHNVLNKIIIEDEEYNPAKILSKAHEGIVKIFRKEGAIAQANDGMDVSIVVIDTAKNSLTFAGAMNSLLAVRNGEFVEYKADRRGLGGVAALDYNFTKYEVDLQPNDTFFMYSDGFPDQFGGEKGKKFMSKRFKQMLADSAHQPMQIQKENVWNTFNQWTDNHEQIDDVLVVGFRMT